MTDQPLHTLAQAQATIWKLERLLGFYKGHMRVMEDRLRELNQCAMCHQQEATTRTDLGPLCGDCEERIARRQR